MPKSFGTLVRVAVCLAGISMLGACNQAPPAHPDQPIQFPHSVHAADNDIPCLYCHQSADKSYVASVPSVDTCMNCHKNVAQDKPEVKKLIDNWEKREPTQWNKVHDLPDFVHFNHKRHVSYFMSCATDAVAEGKGSPWDACALADGQKNTFVKEAPFTEPVDENNVVIQSQFFACSQCHGPVWTFETGKRVEPLDMGWCVDCHKKRVNEAPEPQQAVLQARMLDCYTCHK